MTNGELTKSALEGLRALIDLSGDNALRSGMSETPARFLKAMREMTNGYQEDPADHLRKEFDLSDVAWQGGRGYDGLIISGAVPFVSLCEHHMLPFHGEIHMGYIPGEAGKVVGLSKLARMADGFARRFQVQERLTQQILSAMETTLQPTGAGVIIKAQHSCQCFRGVRKSGYMVTSSMHGVLRESAPARAEFMAFLNL